MSSKLFFKLPDAEREAFLAAFFRAGGLERWPVRPEELLDQWSRTIEKCRGRYLLGLDDYRHDLTRREILQDVLDAAGNGELVVTCRLLSELDDQFRAVTIALPKPVFPEPWIEREPEKYFFYFRVPHAPDSFLIEGLINMKLIRSEEDFQLLTSG